jgi:hypothetical protein
VEPVAERFGPEVLQEPVRVHVVGRRQVHRSEAARVVEGDPRARLGVEHDVVVLFGRRVDVMEDAGRGTQGLPREMIMRPDMPRWMISVSSVDRSARMYFDRRRSRSTRAPVRRSAIRSGNGQRRSGRLTCAARDHGALQHGGEAATDCLDFWKFGHCALSCLGSGV